MTWDGLGITTVTDPVFQLLQSTIESILPEEGDEEVSRVRVYGVPQWKGHEIDTPGRENIWQPCPLGRRNTDV